MIVLKRDKIELGFQWFTVGFIGLLGLALIGVGLYLAFGSADENGAFALIVTGAFLLLLALLVADDALATTITRIIIDDKSVALRLPSRRGYVRFNPINQIIARADITGIEHRTETFGAKAKQESYALALRDGSRLMLGSDRPMIAPFYGNAAIALSDLGVPVRSLGVVKAKTGFILIWGASVPPWDAAPLPEAEASRELRRTENFLVYTRWIVLAGLALTAAARAWG
ncbi:MAG TPA: hypothetical protein PKY87_03395 [Terricaulis sp.]|nr:hypothetical protein [Terricaulis sp.]